MNYVNAIIIGVTTVALLILVAIVFKTRIPRRLRTDKFARQWKDLQSRCKDKKMWPGVLKDADELLDSALKRRKFKGKSMGERMVSAQRVISNNDSMWFAHNFTKKLIENPSMRPKEAEVKSALLGFRSALKDLGAIRTATPAVSDEATQEEKV